MRILPFGWQMPFVCSVSRCQRPLTRARAVSESESELFTGDTSKDNHSPGMIYVLVLGIGATIFRVNITSKRNNIRTKTIKINSR